MSQETPFVTGVPLAPITMSRHLPTDLGGRLKNPGLPRVNSAPDADHPEGSDDNKKEFSVLQQHVEFFDRNKDGIIYPWETFEGFRAIGFNIPFSAMAMVTINGLMGYFSQDSWIPDPRFGIYIKNIHRCKHGSDSEVYDTEGRFVPEKFEEIFSKYDHGDKKALTAQEFWELTQGMRNLNDYVGWTTAVFEWFTLYLLCCNKNGIVKKEDIRRAYDGTLFYTIEKEQCLKGGKKQGKKQGKKLPESRH